MHSTHGSEDDGERFTMNRRAHILRAKVAAWLLDTMPRRDASDMNNLKPHQELIARMTALWDNLVLPTFAEVHPWINHLDEREAAELRHAIANTFAHHLLCSAGMLSNVRYDHGLDDREEDRPRRVTQPSGEVTLGFPPETDDTHQHTAMLSNARVPVWEAYRLSAFMMNLLIWKLEDSSSVQRLLLED